MWVCRSIYSLQPTLTGSGPVSGVVEVNLYRPCTAFVRKVLAEAGIRFVFSPKQLRLVAGTVPRELSLTGSPHEQLAQVIGAATGKYQEFLGGTVRLQSVQFSAGRAPQLVTDEGSPHLGGGWTDLHRKRLEVLIDRVIREFSASQYHRGCRRIVDRRGGDIGPVLRLRHRHHAGK